MDFRRNNAYIVTSRGSVTLSTVTTVMRVLVASSIHPHRPNAAASAAAPCPLTLIHEVAEALADRLVSRFLKISILIGGGSLGHENCRRTSLGDSNAAIRGLHGRHKAF